MLLVANEDHGGNNVAMAVDLEFWNWNFWIWFKEEE